MIRVAMLADAANRHTQRWSRWLAAQGLDVHLLSDRPPSPDADLTGVTLHQPRWTLLRNLYVFKLKGGALANNRWKHLAWREVIEDLRPDLLHAHEALAYGPTLAHFPGRPRVLTPWGPEVESLADPDVDVERRALILRALHAADVVTTNAPGLEHEWSRLSGVAVSRFDLWSWGIDVARFGTEATAADERLRAEWQLAPGQSVVLSPRLAKSYYRIGTLIDGFHRAALADDVRLVILRAGADDQAWAEVRRAAAITDQEARITLVDRRLTEEEMAAAYRLSEVTVMLPLTDLLSMSLLEALACGSFPLVPDQPCNRAALTDAPHDPVRGTGFLLGSVTPETVAISLRQWFALPAEERGALRLRNAAVIRREHDWERQAPRMLEIYRRLGLDRATGSIEPDTRRR